MSNKKGVINLKDKYSAKLNSLYKETKAELGKAKKLSAKSDTKDFERINTFLKILEPGFAFEEEIKTETVIWAGLGCAYNLKNQKQAKNGEEESIKDDNVLFIDDNHKKEFPYYIAIGKFFKGVGIKPEDYSTLDLTCLRETKEIIIKDLLKYDPFKSFFDENVSRFIDILKLAKPKMVIIGNAFVSNKVETPLKLEFNDEKHCWFSNEEDLEGIIFFRTTMLSGGCMDKGSRQLLMSVVRANLG